MRDTVDQAVKAVRGTGDQVSAHPRTRLTAWPEEACVRLVDELARRIYPNNNLLGGNRLPGVRSGRTVDDIQVGSQRAEARLAAGPGWQRVSSWDVLEKAVLKQKPGASAFVLAGQQSSIGHAFAVYRLEPSENAAQSGVAWIDPLGSANHLISGEVPAISPSHSRAIIIGPDGRVVPDALSNFQESTTTAHSVIDPARDHRYGAVGSEVEVAQPLVLLQGRAVELSGKVLARHSSGAQIVGDTLTFWPGRGRTLHTSEQDGYQPVKHLIPEFVTPPLAAIPGDRGRVPESAGVDLLQRTWNGLAAASADRGTKIPLNQILTEDDGWKIDEIANDLYIQAVNPKAHLHAYTQYTVGVPVDGLAAILDMAVSGLSASDFSPFFTAGRDFGLGIAAEYATQLTGRTVRLQEVPHLTNVPGVQQILGYSWLVFNHVGAVPLWRRFFSGSTVVKNLLPAASRAPLHEIHQALNTDVKNFFAGHHQQFADRFISALNDNFDVYGKTRENRFEEELGLDSETGIGIADMTLGDMLNSALRGDSETASGDVITQDDIIGMKNDFPLDTNDGQIAQPLVLIELRHFVLDSHNFMEHGGFSSPREVSLSFQRTAEVARAGFQHAQALQEQLRSGASPAHQARRTLDALSAWTSLSDAAQQISVRHGSGTVRQLLTAEEAERIRGWVDSFAKTGTVEPALSSRLQALLATTKDLKLPLKRANTADPLAEATGAARALLALLSRHERETAARPTAVPTQATRYVERNMPGGGTPAKDRTQGPRGSATHSREQSTAPKPETPGISGMSTCWNLRISGGTPPILPPARAWNVSGTVYR